VATPAPGEGTVTAAAAGTGGADATTAAGAAEAADAGAAAEAQLAESVMAGIAGASAAAAGEDVAVKTTNLVPATHADPAGYQLAVHGSLTAVARAAVCRCPVKPKRAAQLTPAGVFREAASAALPSHQEVGRAPRHISL